LAKRQFKPNEKETLMNKRSNNDDAAEDFAESGGFFERMGRLWQRRWVRIPVVLALIGCLVGGGLWAVGKFERRQSRKLTDMAANYLKEGKAEEARMGLETALRLDPRNAKALRMIAGLRRAQGADPEALDAMRRLAESGQMSLDDLVIYAQMAARAGDLALAERLANNAGRGGNTVLRHMLRAELGAAKNDPEAVEKELRAAAEADESGQSKLALARFLVQRRLNAETAPEVLAMLRSLSSKNDALGAEAIGMILAAGLVPQSEVEVLVKAIRQHPATNPRLLILADSTEVALNPTQKAEVVRRTAERLKGAPMEQRVEAMVWAMRLGEPATASALITPEEASKEAKVYSLWLDSMAQQNRWVEITAQLSKEGSPLPAYLQGLYAGRALVAAGRGNEGRAEYAKALQTASPKREEFLQAVAYLGAAGEDGLFEQGLRKALEKPDDAQAVMRAVVPAVAMRRDAAQTLKVYEIAASAPALKNDPTLQNDIDYLALMLGRPVDARAIAQRSESNPRDFAFRVTYALALLKAGDGRKALEVLENCEPDVHVVSLPPHHKAIVAAAMASAGKQKEALQVAYQIAPMAVSQQEAAFLVEKLGVAKTPAPKPEPTPTPAPQKPRGKK
jgi:Tfp pilus assembly protein PilF